MTRHEYIDGAVDPFSARSCQTRFGDNWNCNNAIGDRLFRERGQLRRAVPEFRFVAQRFSEAVLLVNSGGVNNKTPYIPLPKWAAPALVLLDRALCRWAPDIFAICQEITLVETSLTKPERK